jgi:hypothetical protein
MADRIGDMADHLRAEIAAGRVTGGAQCRPAIRAKWPEATDSECLMVALRIGAEMQVGMVIKPANGN